MILLVSLWGLETELNLDFYGSGAQRPSVNHRIHIYVVFVEIFIAHNPRKFRNGCGLRPVETSTTGSRVGGIPHLS
jgi:hypothetical protein